MSPELQQLPRYQCHKVVRAGKIVAIDAANQTLVIELGPEVTRAKMSLDWIVRNRPDVGGYVVVYDDDYVSYSPAKAFEEGYTAISERAES